MYPDSESSDPAIKLDDKLSPIIRAARPAWKYTRHQHYLADIVARLCRRHGRRACDNASSPNLKNLFMRGVYDTFDGRLQALLRAARALDHGDCCSAILEIVGLDFSAAFARRSGAAAILRRIADAIRQDLRGDEIAVLARNMKSVDSGEAISALDGMEAGAVVKFIDEKGYGFIRREAGGNDVFFHISAWRNATYPSIGETVVFKSYVDGLGKEKASFVQAAA